jgi:hypothetical protein
MFYAIKGTEFFRYAKSVSTYKLFPAHIFKTCILNELLLDFSLLSILPWQHRKNGNFLDYTDVLIVCLFVSHLKFEFIYKKVVWIFCSQGILHRGSRNCEAWAILSPSTWESWSDIW